MKDDLRSGFGVQTRPGKHRYSGQWENNKFHGKGEYVKEDGIRYIGSFKNGKYHGDGHIITPMKEYKG